MEKPRYTIRDAVPADAEAIAALFAQSWLDTYPNEAIGITREWIQQKASKWPTEESLEVRRQSIRESEGNKDALNRVAESEDHKIIGIISPFRTETTQRVGALYVDKAYHGTGLAQELMDHIIDWADPHRPLELEVASYNERAKAFYRKYGFKEIENSEHIVHEIIPVVAMTRKGDQQ